MFSLKISWVVHFTDNEFLEYWMKRNNVKKITPGRPGNKVYNLLYISLLQYMCESHLMNTSWFSFGIGLLSAQ